MTSRMQVVGRLDAAVSNSARRASEYLLGLQHPEGYWCGELTADTTLESDYILLQLWLHPPEGGVWNPPTRDLVGKAVRSILARQLPDGGFNIYAKGPADISATVRAYFALKVAGVPPDSPELSRARERILFLGGLQTANSYVKINLSLFGLYPLEHYPSIPLEMALLPGNFIYRMSAWTRAIVVALSIIHAHNPLRPVPAGFDLKELFLSGARMTYRGGDTSLSGGGLFLKLDKLVRLWEKPGSKRSRARAIREAERWMLERTRSSDGLGAIYPPMMYAIMALDVLGYSRSHPDFVEAESQSNRLLTDDSAMVLLALSGARGSRPGAQEACTRRAVQWLLSMQSKDGGWTAFDADHNAMLDPTWPDITGRVLEALCSGGLGGTHSAVRRGVEYLMRAQEQDGSWYGRWGVNYIYGTFLALRGLRAAGESDREACVLRAGEWLRSIQNADGGWGESCSSYDRNCFVPAESTASQTTWAVLGLLASGDSRSQSVASGIEYLLNTQRDDGSWDEELSTGTGFPRVFYLTYNLYRQSFPLLALADFLRAGDAGAMEVA